MPYDPSTSPQLIFGSYSPPASDSPTVTFRGSPQPPTTIELESIDGRHATIAWEDYDDAVDTFTVLVRPAQDSQWTEDGTVPAADGGRMTYETAALLDGQPYDVAIRVTDVYGNSARSSTATELFQTGLPDATGLSLDGTPPSELDATWDQVLNNGQYRLEFRDDDPDGDHPDFEHEITVSYDDNLAHTIADVLDGEQFSVRIRTETADATGEWLAGEEITKLYSADGVVFGAVSATELTITWTNNSVFEGGNQIYRRRLYPNNEGRWRLIGTAAPDATEYTDDTATPDVTYEYYVRAQTQWIGTDSNTSGSIATEDIGLSHRAVPTSGPYVEVDHPTESRPLTPQPRDIQRNPTVNDFPTVEIPIQYSEKWHSGNLDAAPMRVWYGGNREPIDTLEHRSLDEGSGSKETVLEGRGGTQLDRRVIEDVNLQETHEFIEYLIGEYTDYVPDIDDPQSDIDEGVVLQSADTAFELEQALAEQLLEEINEDETLPVEISEDGRILPLRTCDIVDLSGSAVDDQYSGGSADNTDPVQSNHSFGYTIPAEHIGLAVREGDLGSDVPDIEFQFNNETIATLGRNGTDSPEWTDALSDVVPEEDIEAADFGAFEVGTGDDPHIVDCVAVFDQRFHDASEFSDAVHEPGGYLNRPYEYPQVPVEVLLEEITTPLTIRGLTLSVETDDGQPPHELGLGIDGSDTDWSIAEDVLEHSIEYDNLGTVANAYIGLGYKRGLEPQDQTPRFGYEPEAIDSLELTADLDDTPVLTDRSFDDRLMNVLENVSDIGNFVFAVDQEDDETIIRVTRLEGRPESVDPDIADYSIDRQTEDLVDRAIIYGGAQRVTRQFVDVDLGSWVDLPFEGKIVEGQVEVQNEDATEDYDRGEDYDIKHTTEDGVPQIQALSGGDIIDGETIRFNGDVKPRGEYLDPGVESDHPKTIIEDISGLASAQMCEQVALYSVEETGDAVVEVSITIPNDSVGWDLISAIDPAELPGEGPYQLRDVDSDSTETTITAGTGQTASEYLDEVDNRTQRTEKRV